jgi:hypothetical protein
MPQQRRMKDSSRAYAALVGGRLGARSGRPYGLDRARRLGRPLLRLVQQAAGVQGNNLAFFLSKDSAGWRLAECLLAADGNRNISLGRRFYSPLPTGHQPLDADRPLTAGLRACWSAATRFRDLALNRCHAFLPGEEGAGGWCCGRPVAGDSRFLARSYCALHRAIFRVALRRRS